MAKDKRDDKPESTDQQESACQAEELQLERELLAEQSRLLDARRAELDSESQRLTAERAELERQQAEFRTAQAPAAIQVSAAASPAPNSKHVIMHVLRKFRFQYPLVTRGETIIPGGERWFEKGDNVLDLDNPQDAFVLNHPWIRDHLADGRIEHPQKTLERLTALAEESKHQAASRRAAIEQAENALLQHATLANKGEAAAEAFLREMNTPINQRNLL